jgi:hypothetical protein
MHENIPTTLAKKMDLYVLPSIAQCANSTSKFDLLMSITNFGTFAFVINVINKLWISYHVTTGLFEALDTFEANLGKKNEISFN